MEVTLLMTIFFLFLPFLLQLLKTLAKSMTQKNPTKQKTKTFEMYGFHICVIFFLSLKLIYIFSIPNCLLFITIVLHYNLHQSPFKKRYVCM